ncbi:hypothetical protein H7169_03720 [Candidatus Gracilibacteria bacterium]|nr:hypothetical protein [Candidatus Gracilibacteria bacterium]
MKNTLYINPLTPEINFLIFDGEQTIARFLTKNLDTASTFPKLLINIVDAYQIDEIWCINGPGPFTLMRVVTLAINALTYTRIIDIKSCHFFDMVTSGHIPIIEANLREFLIMESTEMTTISKNLLPEGTYEGIFSDICSTESTKLIQYIEVRASIVDVFSKKQISSRISPIYFKPPHITCPKP